MLGALPVCWGNYLFAGGATCLLGELPVCWGNYLFAGGTTCLLGELPVCWGSYLFAGGTTCLLGGYLFAGGGGGGGANLFAGGATCLLSLNYQDYACETTPIIVCLIRCGISDCSNQHTSRIMCSSCDFLLAMLASLCMHLSSFVI